MLAARGSTTTGAAGEAEGLVPRLVRDLFTELGASGAGQELRFCYVQLYNEEFLDLLAPNSGATLKLVEDPNDSTAFMQIQGAAEVCRYPPLGSNLKRGHAGAAQKGNTPLPCPLITAHRQWSGRAAAEGGGGR